MQTHSWTNEKYTDDNTNQPARDFEATDTALYFP